MWIKSEGGGRPLGKSLPYIVTVYIPYIYIHQQRAPLSLWGFFYIIYSCFLLADIDLTYPELVYNTLQAYIYILCDMHTMYTPRPQDIKTSIIATITSTQHPASSIQHPSPTPTPPSPSLYACACPQRSCCLPNRGNGQDRAGVFLLFFLSFLHI